MVKTEIETAEPICDVSAAIAARSFGDIREEVARLRSVIDRSLDEVSQHPRLARMVVTRELGFEPSPEALHAIVRIATAGDLHPGTLEIAHDLLALTVLAERLTGRLLDSGRCEPEALRSGGRLAGEVLARCRLDRRKLLDRLDESDESQREFLLEVASCLAVERDDLIAAALVTPRLEQMIVEARGGRLADGRLALGDHEITEISSAAADGGESLPGCRARINAIALRSLLREHLARVPTESSTANVTRARKDLLAYPVIAQRLQVRQETAMAAGLSEFAGDLRRTRRELFAVYLELNQAIEEASLP